VPTPVKHAIKMLVSHWYENREPIIDMKLMQTPFSVKALLDPDCMTNIQ
jgi:hypothetical protein